MRAIRNIIPVIGMLPAAIGLTNLACSGGSDAGGGASAANSVVGGDSTATGNTLPFGYDSLSATDKQSFIWGQIVDTDYLHSGDGTLPPWTSMNLFTLGKLALLDLSVSVNRVSDEMPAGRTKLIHQLGTEVQVEIVPDPGSTQTGMLAGAIGIARFSLGKPPDDKSFQPAIALKMFADGQPSQNLVAEFSMDGQGANYDFFANQMTNLIPKPNSIANKAVAEIFSKVSSVPEDIVLSDFVTNGRSGTALDPSAAAVPAQLWLVPTKDVAAVQRDNSLSTDFRDDLAKIPAGTPIYDITIAVKQGDTPVHVGQLFTRSQVIASGYGDSVLFFRHNVTP
jgi:hypothetical protein